MNGHEHKVSIELALAKILKRGGYGKMITPLIVCLTLKNNILLHDDNDIVAQLLFKCGVSGWFDIYPFAIVNY